MSQSKKDKKQIISKAIGDAITTARMARCLSQEELGESISMNRMSIHYIENGHRMPSVLTLVCIARALRVPVSELAMSLDDLSLS